jgi:hypothetical protein
MLHLIEYVSIPVRSDTYLQFNSDVLYVYNPSEDDHVTGRNMHWKVGVIQTSIFCKCCFDGCLSSFYLHLFTP